MSISDDYLIRFSIVGDLLLRECIIDEIFISDDNFCNLMLHVL